MHNIEKINVVRKKGSASNIPPIPEWTDLAKPIKFEIPKNQIVKLGFRKCTKCGRSINKKDMIQPGKCKSHIFCKKCYELKNKSKINSELMKLKKSHDEIQKKIQSLESAQ